MKPTPLAPSLIAFLLLAMIALPSCQQERTREVPVNSLPVGMMEMARDAAYKALLAHPGQGPWLARQVQYAVPTGVTRVKVSKDLPFERAKTSYRITWAFVPRKHDAKKGEPGTTVTVTVDDESDVERVVIADEATGDDEKTVNP